MPLPLKSWIEATRPKTLAAAVVPIMVGAAEAYRQGSFAWFPVLICLAFALLVQIGTNMANDYFDHAKGADTEERVGPERMVSSGRIQPKTMLVATLAVFLLAFLIGLSLVSYRGWELLIVGIVSILFGYAYTGGPYPLAYHGLGDIFVIVFFGLVATGGTYYVVVGNLTPNVLLLGGSLGLLANNILVVNNYRDLVTDEKANKRTLVVRYGRSFALLQYVAQLMGANALLCVYAVKSGAYFALTSIVLLPLGILSWQRLPALRGRELNPLLGQTARLLLLFGILVSLGIVFHTRWG